MNKYLRTPLGKKRRIVIFIFAGLFLILAGFITALHIIIPGKICQQLKQISPDLQINYSSIHTSLFASTISLHDLDICFTPDANKNECDSVHFSKMDLNGINFLQMVLFKNFFINKIHFEKARISLSRSLLEKKDTVLSASLSKLKIPFKKIKISEVQLINSEIILTNGLEEQPLLSGDIFLNALQKNRDNTDLNVGGVYCNFNNITYQLPNSVNAISIHKLIIDSKKEILQIDSFALVPLKKQEDPMQASIAGIKMTGFDVMQLRDGKLIAGELSIEKPEITVSGNKKLNDYFGDVQLGINLKNFRADKISLVYKKGDERMQCNGNVSIEKIEIDHMNNSFTPENFHVGSMRCNFSDISYTIPGKYHTVEIKSMELDSKDQLMEIKSLKVTPQYSKYEFGRKHIYQGNWTRSSIPEIRVTGLDASNLFQQKFFADKLFISSCSTYVFRDRRLPRRKRNQLLPVAVMKTLSADIRIKTLVLDKSFVEYEEHKKDWHKTGILKLERMQMTLSPFINHPRDGDPDHIDLNVSGSVMGSGTAEAHFNMPLGKQENYYVKGVFYNLDLSTLNSTAENLGDFHIRSGLLNFLRFEFNMTAEEANGKIVGEYHNLIVDKLKIDEEDSTKKEVAGFSTFVVHNLIIPKNKDITLPEQRRTGKVKYRRDPTRFVTFYFIKSLLDGIRASFRLGFLLPK